MEYLRSLKAPPQKYLLITKGIQSNSVYKIPGSILIKGSRLLLAMKQIKLCAIW